MANNNESRNLELLIQRTADQKVSVTCNGQFSHDFTLGRLPAEPAQLGRCLFEFLFPENSPARGMWNAHPKRILLVAEEKGLDAIPWEYLYGPDGFVTLDVLLVRGLPSHQRQEAPDLGGTALHIVAVPSNPIAHEVAPLDIEGEWRRLRETVEGLGSAVTLERSRPPTLEQTRRLVANQRHRVVHFMGHGGWNEKDSVLYFEDERGGAKAVLAQEFIRRIEDTAFLVTLNACVSATPGETEFSNFARALVERGVPYALGMRWPIADGDAKAFSRTFYDELARGSSVENALRQARNSLAESMNPWAVGTPVLYTCLADAGRGFETPTGTPRVEEYEARMEVYVLPKAEGAFQGRVGELLALGEKLTGEPRARLITIHGTGGQGKTALAREAADRFGHAWPGGVWAISLEDLPSRAEFCRWLGNFLEIASDQIVEEEELERILLKVLQQQRVLVILDNAETFTEAVRAGDEKALGLAGFLRERLPGTLVSLLVTTREALGWPEEQTLELEGLSKEEGAALFRQSASQRMGDIQMGQAEALSVRMEGHPLALLLLGLAFNGTPETLEQFMAAHEERLLGAENRYKGVDHRHRTLYASIETSVRYLEEGQKELLSGLWIFRAPFLAMNVGRMFTDPELAEAEANTRREEIGKQLYGLFRRGLLVREEETLREGNILLYRSLPTIRLFAQKYLPQAYAKEYLKMRMAKEYRGLLRGIDDELDKGQWASYLAVRCRDDLERCAEWVEEGQRGWYENRLGWVLHRTGDPKTGLGWLEKALERAQGTDQQLELDTINKMALVYQSTGQPGKALELFEQALPILREVGDRAGEAVTLNNMAGVYLNTGQPGKALELFEQALPILREVGNRAGEAATLNNMAGVYQDTGQPGKALELFEQALPIRREVGDRRGEGITYFNMALLYRDLGQDPRAVECLRQAVLLEKEAGHPDYLKDAATLAQWEAALKRGEPLPKRKAQSSGLDAETVQTIVGNTIAVLTEMPEKRGEWRGAVSGVLEQARAQNLHNEEKFLEDVLDILDGKRPVSEGTAYEAAVRAILQGISNRQPGHLAAANHAFLPDGLPADFVLQCVRGLKGPVEEKQALFDYLRGVARRSSDRGVEELVKTVQMALFGKDLHALGAQLVEPYAAVWREIVDQVK